MIVLWALAAPLCAAGASASNDTDSMQDMVRAIAAQTNKLRHTDAEHPDSLAARMQRIAQQITDNTKQQATERLAAKSQDDKTHDANPDSRPSQTPRQRIYLFVSRSLKSAALKEIFRTIGGTSVTAVFRGIPKGAKINEASGGLYRLIRSAKIKPIPNISLNPKRWRTFDVQSVPTMIMAEGDRVIARVSGLTNPRWLREQVRAGNTGDLGVRGPIAEPSEPDLITVMKKRASQLDFAKLRDKATHSYWEHAPVIDLPPATRDQRRKVDLSMRVTRDITAPDGTVIAHRGQVINPLDSRAFTLRLVIFDATRPEQVAFAHKQARLHPDALLLASRFDNDRGWKGYRALNKQLGREVYRLPRDVRSRFEVRATPSVVHANDAGRVVIDEHHVEPKPSTPGKTSEEKNAD